ncbi:Uma2 family endonuclease [Yinghuangia sp. YIM S09857]|uniref:Uma2 family endonuclease n=1 Tax=Yinghuangia sp. YIM S09857 TaxID=3436929 RepID=UPI003F533495
MTLISEEAAVANADARTNDMQAVFDSYDPPEGVRVELIDGRIVVSPTPVPGHSGLLMKLYEQFLREHKPEGTDVSFSPVTIYLPDSPRGDNYVPDLSVFDAKLSEDFDNWKVLPDAVHLVVEVVSAGRDSQRDDRTVKPRGYASGPIPLYLLIDPLQSEVTLFSEPENGRYRRQLKVPYGDNLPFPEPFDAVLDTSIFLR